MRTKVESEADTSVRLHVEVDATEFKEALDSAAGRLGKQVRIPGFRKGRVPRRVLEARVGTEAIAEEAVHDALPEYLATAIEDEALDVVGRPEIEGLEADVDKGVSFDAVLTLRPEVELKDWEGIAIETQSPEVAEKEIDEQIEAYQRQSAPVEAVSRTAGEGDFVLIDLRGYIHDAEVPGTNLSDFLYEVGSNSVLPELDKEVTGKRAGDILKFNAKLPESFEDQAGQEASFSVVVKEVRERKLPKLDDDWVDENTEFETVDELKGDVRTKLESMRRLTIASAARESILKALAAKVDLEPPDALVDEELERMLETLAGRLRMQGISLEQYLEATGESREAIADEQRAAALESVKSDLALRAIARDASVEVSDQERDDRVAEVALRTQRSVDDVTKTLDRARGWSALEADIIRAKTLDLAASKAEIKDESGKRVEWSAVVGKVGESDGDADDLASVDDADDVTEDS